MSATCQHCGTPLREHLIPGTKIVSGWSPCPNDWCPNPTRQARERSEFFGIVIALVVVVGVYGAFYAIQYGSLQLMENAARENCEQHDGDWTPVRGWLDLPTGEGVCTP